MSEGGAPLSGTPGRIKTLESAVAYLRASAPETISISSLVMTAWRVRL